jgi:hypothetical protein
MTNELIEVVLPRLSQRLNRQLRRYQDGQIDDAQFTRRFENLLQQQHAWLANQGVPDIEAALTVHGAVLVLSRAGLRSEAEEQGVPLEIVEFRAVLEAAEDISGYYGVRKDKILRRLVKIVATYSE